MYKLSERQYTKQLKEDLGPIEKIIGEKILNATCEETYSIINGISKFRVDIKGELESDSSPILIEAQYKSTDHKHLGQLITYASHHNAKILVWIAEGIREEHLRAVRYINEMAKLAEKDLYIYLLCVNFYNDIPKYKIADESDIQEGKLPGEYKQDESEKRFWEEFAENYLPVIDDLEFKQGKIKSDYSEIRFGKHYHFNLAIRQGYNQLKVELICANSKKGQILFDTILNNQVNIMTYLNSKLDNAADITIHDRNVTVTFNANIYNYDKWGEYMKNMKSAISCVYNLVNDDVYKV